MQNVKTEMELIGYSNNFCDDNNSGMQMDCEEEGDEWPEKGFFNNNQQNKNQLKEDENEDNEDEPDFMDNSGQLWAFKCQIRDEQHLEEWCNRMGEMRLGMENNKIRRMDCLIENCEFQAVYLKSASIVYTRNEHNHGLENEKDEEEIEEKPQQYFHHFGKLWHFYAKIGKSAPADLFRREFDLSKIKKLDFGFSMHCQKKMLPNQRCQFRAIYVEKNGCLYARGEHEHEHEKVQKFGKKNKEKTVEQKQEYRDRDGKLWPFHEQIGKNISQDIFHKKFGFTKIQTRNPTLNLYCLKKGPGPNGKCPFSGIYVKANGCLYIRGKHDHTGRIKKSAPNVGDDYVDQYGKLWQFTGQLGNNVQHKIFRKEFGFTKIHEIQTAIYLYCRRNNGPDGWKCKFAGIYLKANGCLYTRGKHEHK